MLKHIWINEISYRDTQKREFSLNVLELRERDGDKETTSLAVSEKDVDEFAKIGRCRWKIENQGFNCQKNGGFEEVALGVLRVLR